MRRIAKISTLGLALLLLPTHLPARELTPIVMGQLRYRGGDADPRPNAIRPLVQYLISRTSVEVEAKPTYLEPGSPQIFSYPFLWWFGTRGFPPLTTAERENLRRWLRFGGFLFVDDNQGSRGVGFDEAVRRELAAILPDAPLQRLPRDHTVYRSFYLMDRAYGRASVSEDLEGATLQGRTVVVFSSNDLAGALSQDPYGNFEYQLPGASPQGSDDLRRRAFQLGVNLLFYALCDDYKKDSLHVDYILKRRRMNP